MFESKRTIKFLKAILYENSFIKLLVLNFHGGV